MKLVYHSGYDLNLGAHVFPSKKYALIHERLTGGDFVTPEPASDEDLLRVHTARWIGGLRDGKLTDAELRKLEIPYSDKMVEAFWLAAGGSILAARCALKDRIGFNIGGGFHHAFADHGEGFCAIHDVAVAIRKLQAEGLVERAMVIDTDVHQGNGTAAIFADDPSVFTLSIHQLNNYPAEKPPSTLDIHLRDGVEDQEYLERLEAGVEQSLASFKPQLVMYVAGADPYREDQLGGLRMTIAGLKARDRLVFDRALTHGAAVAVSLAGGYAVNVEDTVTIHANTAHAAMDALVEQ